MRGGEPWWYNSFASLAASIEKLTLRILHVTSSLLIERVDQNNFLFFRFYQSTEGCPTFEDADTLTDMQLFERLVHPCRFDKIQRPERKLVENFKFYQKFSFSFNSCRRKWKSSTSWCLRSSIHLLSSKRRGTLRWVQHASPAAVPLRRPTFGLQRSGAKSNRSDLGRRGSKKIALGATCLLCKRKVRTVFRFLVKNFEKNSFQGSLEFLARVKKTF